jgi:hypothetical protein
LRTRTARRGEVEALRRGPKQAELAKRIETGLYAAERVHRSQDTTQDATDKLAPQLRRDLRWIVMDITSETVMEIQQYAREPISLDQNHR